jgi:hypothetical protein
VVIVMFLVFILFIVSTLFFLGISIFGLEVNRKLYLNSGVVSIITLISVSAQVFLRSGLACWPFFAINLLFVVLVATFLFNYRRTK